MSLINTLKQLCDYCNKQANSENQQGTRILKSHRTPPSTRSISVQTAQEAQGQILTQTIFKRQGTIQRHSDILEKEAQAPREERKETQNKTNKQKKVWWKTHKALSKPKRNQIFSQVSSRIELTLVNLFSWYQTAE